ncbi:AraC family transcriptional regulator [Dokdonella sp.]|uniref:helix-turn-helix domain-containing protein n=1 Tax=Dokdonella sp. TaxID=2291710 RepID=UPI001B144E11|nr:AraC family transcriptional regulator [Dokdonella sp.]MBO9663805.1 helix-turn-helix transcriptional regulator [Dokdonella sp.]
MTPVDILNCLSIGATLGLTVLAAALALDSRTGASRCLAGFFACVALDALFGGIPSAARAWLSEDALRWFRVVVVPNAYLLGPLLYGYAKALTSAAPSVDVRRDLRHALPCAVVLAFSLGNALAAFDRSPTGRMLVQFTLHAWVLQGVPYLVLAARRTYAARPLLEQVNADEAALHLAWLRRLVAVIGAMWLLEAIDRIPRVAGLAGYEGFNLALAWLTFGALFLLAWFALRQRVLIPPEVNESLPIGDESPVARYERSGLDPAQCARIADELARLMRSEHLYADSRFDLRELSRRSGWPPSYISQALNQGLRQNFFEFVNGFRIAAAQRCLADPDDRRTTLDIALACGFGSKSTFNAVFKRMSGMTPREFRRSASSC